MKSRFNRQTILGFLFLGVFLISVFSFSGCVGQEEEAPETVTVTEQALKKIKAGFPSAMATARRRRRPLR